MEKEAKKEAFRKYLDSSGVLDALTKVLVALYEQNDRPTSAIEFVQQKLGGPTVSEFEKLQAEMSDLQIKYKELLAEHQETRRQTMSTKEQPPPSLPKLVKLDKAFKLAEQWVNNMSGTFEEESTEVELEGRPAGLGLGAKVPVKSKPVHTNDPIGRKLLAKLDVKKRKAMGAEESNPSAKVSGNPFATAYGDDDDDDNLESRTNAFSSKRAVPLTTTVPTKKKSR